MNSNAIVCIGEVLIDFFCKDAGVDLQEGSLFIKQAGGAPANVCASIVRLGGEALFAGKAGDDPFGRFLKHTLDELGIDTTMLLMDNRYPTTLAFVSLKLDGERDFVFHRGADAHLTEEELDEERLLSHSVLHFGSATALLENPFRSSYIALMEKAKKKGRFLSFDPNYRSDLWKGNETCFIQLARKGASLADFIKVSAEELRILTGLDDVKEGTAALHSFGANAVAVTLGKEGTFLSNGRCEELIASIPIQSIDSTGAGDAFTGAVLYQIAKAENPHHVLDDFKKLCHIISFSNKVGALVCTKVGAISALPSLEEVNSFQVD
ncbi:carbohydrate kinase [Metabacillus sp. GX 13764]|uniref:carbohydrate kinase family protein n=1 Tax=Metabacillus kandeliae TaxID=2900151 RepID=UPI001E5173AA|nr:carbohydrate kinase [Metabacillus kandeliae]MCD7034362.1 carbohydrate kinase [Metabacillus kandeliae]